MKSEALLTDLKQVEESYATQALDLTLTLGYVERLVSNSKVEKYLTKHHSDILNEFKKSIREKVEGMSGVIPDRVK